MSKKEMATLEKFYRIVDKFGIASVRKKHGGYAVYNDTARIGPYQDTKDEAIEAAFSELFPPIEKEYGEGDGIWIWDADLCGWKPSFWENKGYILQKAQSKFGIGYRFEGYLTPAAYNGLLVLINKNPELKSPTEEEKQ